MELRISREPLLKVVQRLQPVAERKSTLPILGNILISAKANGVDFYATDLDIGYRDFTEAEIKKEGTTTVSAKSLHEILRELPSGIQVRMEEEKQRLLLHAGNSKFRLPTIPPEEFPSFPNYSKESSLDISSEILSEMIRKTIFAISPDETRYTLNGVLLQQDGSELRMISTDGHRLAMIRKQIAAGSPRKAIIPRKALAEIRRMCEEGPGNLSLILTETHLIVLQGGVIFFSRLIEGEFPDYRQVIPKDCKRSLSAERKLLWDAAKRVSLLAGERTKPVRLEISAGSLWMRSQTPELGEAEEQVPVRYEGEEITIGFKGRYITEALAALDSQEVTLELNESLTPGILRPYQDDEYLCVIMPMRL